MNIPCTCMASPLCEFADVELNYLCGNKKMSIPCTCKASPLSEFDDVELNYFF